MIDEETLEEERQIQLGNKTDWFTTIAVLSWITMPFLLALTFLLGSIGIL